MDAKTITSRLRRGFLPEAEEHIRNGERLLPDHRATWRVVASLDYALGNYRKALDLMEKAKAAEGQWDEEADDFLEVYRETSTPADLSRCLG